MSARSIALAVVVGLGCVAGAPRLQASGFLLDPQSAEAVGKGAAMTAAARGPDAVWFNPAGLAADPRAGVSLGAALVLSGTRFSPEGGGASVQSRPGRNVVPSLFAALPLGRRLVLGLGLFAPFGLAVRWPEGWPGAERSLHTRIVVLAANPALAAAVHDRVSIAVGGSVLRASVEHTVALAPEIGGQGSLRGRTRALALNAGLLVHALPGTLDLGLTYRGRARLRFRGDADFSPTSPVLAETVPDQAARAEIHLPDTLALGARLVARQDLILSLDVAITRWTAFDRLFIDFEHGATPDIIIERRGRDPLSARAGVEWRPNRGAVTLRGGVLAEQSASHPETLSPATPDAHRLAIGAGVGWSRRRVTTDVGLLLAHFLPAEATGRREGPPGTYRTRVAALALTLTAR